MHDRYGIILLDGDEVVIRIYEQTSQGLWKLLRYQSHDLTTFQTENHIQTTEIVEVIARISTSQYALHVLDWKICTRGLPEQVAQEVATGTSIKTEVLTLNREQELLCKGILMEM